MSLPSTIKSIGSSAFSGSQLTSLDIPEGFISIGDYAFSQNPIQSLSLPSTIKSIGSSAFSNSMLTSLVIPEGVQSIGDFAFTTSKLQFIFFPYSLTSIGSYAFSSNKLDTVIIPDNATNIGANAFAYNQTNPANLTIYGASPSTAQTYANSNKHTFSDMGTLKLLTVNIQGQGQGTVQARVYGQTTLQPVAGTHVYTVGTELQLSQTANQHWDFKNWTVDGSEIDGVENPNTTIVMSDDITVNVCFERKKPVYFYGSVTYNNSSGIPEGYIDVVIDGQLKATKKFAAGKYGNNDASDYLVIERADFEYALENGKEICFEVNGSKASHSAIDWSIESGQVVNLVAPKYYTDERYFQYWVPPSWGTEAQIDRYSSDGPKDVKIPKKLGGYPVTRINAYREHPFDAVSIGAFERLGLTSVVIPVTVTSIEGGAFSWNQLEEVTIPGSVTYIGPVAFWGNKGTSTAAQKPAEFIILGVGGSAAEEYAKCYGHTFIPIS